MSSFQLHTSVTPTSGSVQINAVFLSHGSVMARMTVAINLMKTLLTAPHGPADRDSSGVAMGVAFLRAGNVTWIMIVVTILMNH